MGRISNTHSAIIFLLLPFVFFGQNDEEIKYYNWFDQVIGEEYTGLYNGKQYVDLDLNRISNNKHAFFRSDKVLTGSVTYDSQTYYTTGMKYNLETDKLLVALKPGAVVSVLQLIDNKIDNFTIDGSRFVRIDDFVEDGSLPNGFYEVLLERSSFTLYKRHEKNRKETLDGLGGNKLYYEFLSSDKYVLFVSGNYSHIKNKSDIISIYPNLKKEIKLFYTSNKRLKKSEPDRFMQRLFEKVIQSSSKNKSL